LLVVGGVQEQFDEPDAVIDEHLLKGANFVIGALPLFWPRQPSTRSTSTGYQVRSKIAI
jgi:hypothetical protein